MSTVSEIMQAHAQRMREIEAKDRDSTLALAAVHSMMLYQGAAELASQRGNQALADVLKQNAPSVFEILRGQP